MHTNMQHLLALLQEGYTTILVKFPKGDQEYTYKVPLSMGVSKEDLLVVPALDSFAVVTVTEVHGKPKIDVKEPVALKWVVQKVDTTAYDDQTARESQAIEQLEVAERRKAQEEALEALLGSTDREALLKLIRPA